MCWHIHCHLAWGILALTFEMDCPRFLQDIQGSALSCHSTTFYVGLGEHFMTEAMAFATSDV